MARMHWFLASEPSGDDVPGQWHPWRGYPAVFLVGGGFGSDGLVFPEIRALVEYSADALARGFWISLWLLSRETVFFLEDNVLTRMVHARSTIRTRNAGALGGRATRTSDETIRPMGSMVSLYLPPPSRLTKRRTGLFSKLN